MLFTTFLLSAAVTLLSVTSLPVKRDVDVSLVPQYGVQQGINPDGNNCDGIAGSNGKPILIPCQCPPDRNEFISKLNANVAAGHVLQNPSVQLSFPSDNSTASQLARVFACLVTLQNFNSSGVGCPASSTTWVALQHSISEEGSSPAPSSASSVATSQAAVATSQAAVASSVAAAPTDVCGSVPAASSAAAPAVSSSVAASAASPSVAASSGSSSAAATATGSSSGGVDPNLVPQFGVEAGVNPDGTGNCDGVDGSNSKPILIPCACPPDRTQFIQKLSANVAVGKVITNPSVNLTFPSDNSTASQLARLNAASVTLQNFNSSGRGCPISSTTFTAQHQAILDESS
ncbi:hypothetical protein BKA93DRAFT_232580 [Sparassis latifolia]